MMDHNIRLPTLCEECFKLLDDSVSKALHMSRNKEFYYAAVYCHHDSTLAVTELVDSEVLGVSMHSPLTEDEAASLMQYKMGNDVVDDKVRLN